MKVLILSESHDISTDKVCGWLQHLSVPFLRLNDFSLLKLKCLSFTNIKDIAFTIEYNNSIIQYSDIGFVWFRRGQFNFSLPDVSQLSHLDQVHQFAIKEHLADETKTLRRFIINLLKKIPHLSDPDLYNINKLEALHCAKNAGLQIPETLVVTGAASLTGLEAGRLVSKSIQDNLRHLGKEHHFRQPIEFVDKYEVAGQFFHTLFQEEIDVLCHIRTFFFAHQYYSISTFSSSGSESSEKYHTTHFVLPLSIKKRLSKAMHMLRLNTGSIDLILSKSNQYFFLEVNPVGQFDQVSVLGNYPIEKDLALYIQSQLS
jgi:hypothetical protein